MAKVSELDIPHDFRRTALRNLERAGVPRSVAMKLTGHKTEAVYRRYAIVCEADLSDGLKKLARLQESLTEKLAPMRPESELSHSSSRKNLKLLRKLGGGGEI